ncbi:MAG: hypothetical protein L6R48_00745, partial [Planctomycetes bacterium]|nr:hypothetical protein [Planctomycetota bacterium]
MCLWEIPGACMSPFVATSGLDGGAICTYPWDVGGYAPFSVAQVLGGGADALLERFAGFGLGAHSRFTPAGNGRDVPYAYNAFS